jgi:serine/threonine-protein kinase
MRKDTTPSFDGDTLPLAPSPKTDGLGDLATLVATPAPAAASLPAPVQLAEPARLAADARFPERYQHRSLLGEGGMGAVDLFRDRAIGREVAIKRIKDSARSGAALERFVREARVQGQLEHPAIVPVHDLAETPEGAAF